MPQRTSNPTPRNELRPSPLASESGTDRLLSHGVLKQTLVEVERDEAEAIDTLCALLEEAERSRDFGILTDVRNVLKQWQNVPPRGIVTSLQELRKTLECQAHDNT